jgi:hypothetical protein
MFIPNFIQIRPTVPEPNNKDRQTDMARLIYIHFMNIVQRTRNEGNAKSNMIIACRVYQLPNFTSSVRVLKIFCPLQESENHFTSRSVPVS